MCLHGWQCLHWQYDWNKHIKPCWALLSKQSLRSSGWHGHSKYSRNTSPTVLKVQLCAICLSLQPVCAICSLDNHSRGKLRNQEEVTLNIVNLMFFQLNLFLWFFFPLMVADLQVLPHSSSAFGGLSCWKQMTSIWWFMQPCTHKSLWPFRVF